MPVLDDDTAGADVVEADFAGAGFTAEDFTEVLLEGTAALAPAFKVAFDTDFAADSALFCAVTGDGTDSETFVGIASSY